MEEGDEEVGRMQGSYLGLVNGACGVAHRLTPCVFRSRMMTMMMTRKERWTPRSVS